MICYTEQELENLIPTITELFENNTNCQFNPISHLHSNCDASKHDLKMGNHRSIKIIYIADMLRPKALEIIEKLDKDYPAHLDEQVSDEEDNNMRLGQRIPEIIFKCPACYMEFDCGKTVIKKNKDTVINTFVTI